MRQDLSVCLQALATSWNADVTITQMFLTLSYIAVRSVLAMSMRTEADKTYIINFVNKWIILTILEVRWK